MMSSLDALAAAQRKYDRTLAVLKDTQEDYRKALSDEGSRLAQAAQQVGRLAVGAVPEPVLDLSASKNRLTRALTAWQDAWDMHHEPALALNASRREAQ